MGALTDLPETLGILVVGTLVVLGMAWLWRREAPLSLPPSPAPEPTSSAEDEPGTKEGFVREGFRPRAGTEAANEGW